ncbi:MAG: PEP-CTERM sorting domain-containing protein, partial [Planctomycetes bacterium]|nr:PEP-CTERM sorting domain-containing protein [Planctomycetota bacterium]
TVDNPDPSVFTTILDVNNATIEVALLGDLTPGEVYQLFGADSIIGTYDNLILPDGVDGSMLLVDGTVSAAVPEPTSAVLALMGLVSLGLFVRRRSQRA